jgi:hypothetical protein
MLVDNILNEETEQQLTSEIDNIGISNNSLIDNNENNNCSIICNNSNNNNNNYNNNNNNDKSKSILLPMDLSFCFKLRKLQYQASIIQYQIACMSTLGGANHLCNRPKEALRIAIKQEKLGIMLSSTSLTLRARVFQAINYGLLGDIELSNQMFKFLKKEAKKEGWAGLISFVYASAKWLHEELEYNNSQLLCNEKL